MPGTQALSSRWMALVSKLRVSLAVGATGIGLLASAAQAQTTPRERPVNPIRPPAGKNANNPAATRPLAKAAAKEAEDALNLKELKVMAVVNGEQITTTQLGHECMRRYGEEVLDSLVNRQLIAQACAQQGIRISESDIDYEINATAKKFGLTVENWIGLLKEERGVSIEQYRQEIIWPTIALRRLASSRTEVSEEEIKQAIETEYGPRVKVRVICTSKDKSAREALAAAKANPGEFSELSKKYSEDPNIASVGGMIPPIRRNLGDKNLEKIAFSLKEGQVSDLIKVQNQYFILLCEGHEPQRIIDPKYMTEVRRTLAERIKDQKLRGASAEIFSELQKEAQVVSIFKEPKLKTQRPGAAALINNTPISLAQLNDECIRRHGRDVLEGEINRKLLTQEMTRKNIVVTQEDLDAEVERAAILYGKTNPDGTANVEEWLAEVQKQDGATIELYILDAVWPSVALKKLVRNKVNVTEDDLKKGFESNYGPRVEVLAIVLSDHRQAQRVWDMARTNPSEEYFGQLATEYSVEPVSKGNGGKVPPVRMHGGQPIVEKEAFKLKKGDLSSLLAVGDKFIILRCLGRTQPVVTKLDDVRDELEADILEKKLNVEMTKTFEQIHTSAQIDNFLVGTSQARKSPGTASATGVPEPKARVGALPGKGGK
jgi:parvulin-like peptidyl-prolyl isomerase